MINLAALRTYKDEMLTKNDSQQLKNDKKFNANLTERFRDLAYKTVTSSNFEQYVEKALKSKIAKNPNDNDFSALVELNLFIDMDRNAIIITDARGKRFCEGIAMFFEDYDDMTKERLIDLYTNFDDCNPTGEEWLNEFPNILRQQIVTSMVNNSISIDGEIKITEEWPLDHCAQFDLAVPIFVTI